MDNILKAAEDRIRQATGVMGCRPWETAVYEKYDTTEIAKQWLIAVGAEREDHLRKVTFRREDALPVGLWEVDDGWKVMLVIDERFQAEITRGLKTRGDVRRLAACLGIKLKEPTQ